MGDGAAETLVLMIQGVQVRVAGTRPAAYVKYLAGAPSETVVAYRAGGQQIGVADSAPIADYLADGQRITFTRPDQVDATVGEGHAELEETKLVMVDGQPMLVAAATTVAQLRTMAEAPPETVAICTANGEHERLADSQRISTHVPAGAIIQFR